MLFINFITLNVHPPRLQHLYFFATPLPIGIFNQTPSTDKYDFYFITLNGHPRRGRADMNIGHTVYSRVGLFNQSIYTKKQQNKRGVCVRPSDIHN